MRRAVTLPESPAVQLLGDAVVLRGPAAIDAYRLIARGVETARRDDGILPPPRVEVLLAALQAAADLADPGMSAAGHADVRSGPTSRESTRQAVGIQVGSEEVADMLQIAPRHVRRLAPELGGRKVAGSWTFDRLAVEAHRIERQQKKETA